MLGGRDTEAEEDGQNRVMLRLGGSERRRAMARYALLVLLVGGIAWLAGCGDAEGWPASPDGTYGRIVEDLPAGSTKATILSYLDEHEIPYYSGTASVTIPQHVEALPDDMPVIMATFFRGADPFFNIYFVLDGEERLDHIVLDERGPTRP